AVLRKNTIAAAAAKRVIIEGRGASAHTSAPGTRVSKVSVPSLAFVTETSRTGHHGDGERLCCPAALSARALQTLAVVQYSREQALAELFAQHIRNDPKNRRARSLRGQSLLPWPANLVGRLRRRLGVRSPAGYQASHQHIQNRNEQ